MKRFKVQTADGHTLLLYYPEKRHAKLSAQYEAEQAQLEQRSAELMEQMNAEQEESVNVDRFMELVDRYTDFTELTTPMLNEFIDKVIVYERKKINRYQYDQQIEIYFNFIGKVTLPRWPSRSTTKSYPSCTAADG